MLLLADIIEVVGILLALLVPLLYAVKQIADAKQAQGPPDGQANAPQQAGPQPPRQAAGQQADPLRDQVEEFLRRAGRGPQGERGRPAPRDIEVLLDEESAVPRRVAEPARPGQARPAVVPLPSAGPTPIAPPASPQRAARRSVIPQKRKTLAERSTERAAARASKMAEQMSHLGQRIIEDDQQFDVQLKAKFDHTVGTLAESVVPTVVLVPNDTPAGRIAAMLASPDGVQQAIILNEIFNRPSDRW